MSTSKDSLMCKTKRELCDIIFRKDDIEKELRTKAEYSERSMLDKLTALKDANEKLEKTKVEVSKLNNTVASKVKELSKAEAEIAALQSNIDDLQSSFDEYMVAYTSALQHIKAYKFILILISVLCICLFLISIF